MPSKLPRLNVVLPAQMRDWLETQRLPCESTAAVIRRILHEYMKKHETSV